MKPLGIRDIIGPVMVGPSSSHTAGALRIAGMARNLLNGKPTKAIFTLYGSFSQTYRGHGTDKALVAGLLGMHTDDPDIPMSFEVAAREGLEFSFVCDTATKTDHPNMVDVDVVDETGARIVARGASVGGGAAELRCINGVNVNITGEFTNLIVRQHDEPGVLARVSGLLAQAGVNIGTVALHRTSRGGTAIVVMDVDGEVPANVVEQICASPAIIDVRVVPMDGSHRSLDDGDADMSAEEGQALFEKLDFSSADQMVAYCDEHCCTLSYAFLQREKALMASQGHSDAGVARYLDKVLSVMRESVVPSGKPTMGGLIGGEAQAVETLEVNGMGFGGDIAKMSSYAMAVLENNASMGRIVAAPTAGSSGVLPAVLLCLEEKLNMSDARLRSALANAGAVGQLIARNATVAGAEGGCQAEIGAASAMAASAAVELMGGSPRASFDAAAIALANMLGLVCDPIGGLVEAPCQKRNASAAANALVSAEMALAGIHGDAPFDEVVDAMARVGRSLPYELRETALGGMATCPSCKMCR